MSAEELQETIQWNQLSSFVANWSKLSYKSCVLFGDGTWFYGARYRACFARYNAKQRALFGSDGIAWRPKLYVLDNLQCASSTKLGALDVRESFSLFFFIYQHWSLKGNPGLCLNNHILSTSKKKCRVWARRIWILNPDSGVTEQSAVQQLLTQMTSRSFVVSSKFPFMMYQLLCNIVYELTLWKCIVWGNLKSNVKSERLFGAICNGDRSKSRMFFFRKLEELKPAEKIPNNSCPLYLQ